MDHYDSRVRKDELIQLREKVSGLIQPINVEGTIKQFSNEAAALIQL